MVNINTSCRFCGKPIVKTISIGMFCEDECGMEDAKKWDKTLDRLIDKICDEGPDGLFSGLEDEDDEIMGV